MSEETGVDAGIMMTGVEQMKEGEVESLAGAGSPKKLIIDEEIQEILPLVTYTSIYYQCVYPHVGPHLSPPTAQQWVNMCIRPICIHIGSV